MSKQVYSLTMERDTTIAIQALFSRVLVEDMQQQLGFDVPYQPMEILYANETNVQFWENTQGFAHMCDQVLARNQTTDFLEKLVVHYEPVGERIRQYDREGPVKNLAELNEYFKTARAAILPAAIFYYTSMDARTPHSSKQIAVEFREKNEIFAHCDSFIHESFIACGLDAQLLRFVLPRELFMLPTLAELQARQKSSIVLDGDKIIVSDLATFAQANPTYIFEHLFSDAEHTDELKGQVANRGQARGRIRIVRNREQAAAVQNGEIIVSPMTTPAFLDAMKRSSAIITDEGGIACHAAITSRELGKPCVVGTKFATRVLKDGDVVEVDADRGVIRKL